MKKFLVILITSATALQMFAGNPDRRGEAGAYELLINGYARSSGFWSMNSACVRGLEAERINVAGMAQTKKTELNVAYSLWLQGSGVGVIQAGVAQNFKETNVVALTINALSLGAIERTTTDNPEGGLGTYKPTFVNIGISYAKAFSNSISGGITVRLISEGMENINAFGFCIDAGLQYVTGPKDNIHFGVALRNVGTPMKFKGEGMSTALAVAASGSSYNLTVDNKANKFELPTQLNIGAAYDIWMGKKREVAPTVFKQDYRLTVVANFSSNAFGNDNYGLGLEFGLREMFMLRAAYRFETAIFKKELSKTVYTGLAAGLTVDIPLKKDGPKLGVDYSFRATKTFLGTHSIGIHFNL